MSPSSTDETIKFISALSPIVVIIISSIIAPILIKLISNISIKVLNKEMDKKKINLFDSGFFPAIKRLERLIYKKDFVSKFKTVIARDLIKIKFKAGYNVTYEWVEKNQDKINSWNNQQLKHELTTLISNIVETYIKEWQVAQIPPLVIDKFQKYHRINEEIVMSMIDITVLNDWETQIQKAFTILDSFVIAFHNAIFDIERVMNPMNGGLRNLTYKGLSGRCDVDFDNHYKERQQIDEKYKSIFVKLSKETVRNSLSESQVEAIDDILSESEIDIKI